MTKILEVAESQIGVEEVPKGSNWGTPEKPEVINYLHSVGIDFPASWCMAFVYWCAKECKIELRLIKTGGVLRQWNEISQRYKFPIPEVGDIFIMDFGHGLGHTGFVEKIEGEFVHTIEGNTNDTGGREGYEVCRRLRRISTMRGFIRII